MGLSRILDRTKAKAQKHKSTKAQQHNSTTAQQHKSTTTQQHNSTTAQQHNSTTAQKCKSAMAPGTHYSHPRGGGDPVQNIQLQFNTINSQYRILSILCLCMGCRN
jgi:hypothetical protein